MKRSSDSTISPRSSKRQASLAAFLKPKNVPSPIITKIHISEGSGQEYKPIVLDDDENPELPKSITTLDKGKGRAVDLCQNDLDLVYYKSFIDKSSSKELMSFLLDNLPWYRVKYMVRGININTPRYTTVFGKDSTDIPWSGYMKCRPRAIPEVLERLMRKVEQVTSSQFNFCLVNYYSSGNDSISYHSDSESFLGPNPTIASLTLGHPRDFLLRHINYKNHPRTGNSVAVEKFVLQDGDMVVMKGKTQHEWEHSIPKRKSAKGRINITFRKGIVKYATENYYNYNVGKGNLHRWDREKGEMKEVEVSDGGVKS
ncbi:hypothetical protein V865_008192 [Kwoniella europaea PYCC6329]|uniref:Fe2OG dioxygenase domain-containing protein n=1 Tax=Kwoniella europaea PYCC6329 TaxID=1423913 RepID=A0AAX4KVW2_9TREE